MRALLLAVVALLALAGCAGAAPSELAAPPASPAPVPASSTPSSLSFPSIGIESVPTDPTGLTDTGELAVPPLDTPEQVVYANWSPELATKMPTVLASHVNGRAADGTAIPGGFANLHRAQPGDLVTVTGVDGTPVTYAVSGVDTIDKDAFPTDRVFAPGPPGRLVLVTCGGDIDYEARSYESNVLIYAEAVPE